MVKNNEEQTTLTIRISASEKEAFAQFCKDLDLSMSQALRRAMKDYIKKNSDREED